MCGSGVSFKQMVLGAKSIARSGQSSSKLPSLEVGGAEAEAWMYYLNLEICSSSRLKGYAINTGTRKGACLTSRADKCC